MRMLFGFLFLSTGCAPLNDSSKDTAQGGESVVDPACVDYRTSYPEAPYGYSVDSVLEDFPGMVDGNDNAQTLTALHQDTSKTVLVIANAFDT